MKNPKTPQTLIAQGLTNDADLLANAVAFYCEDGISTREAEKTAINDAWKRILSLAKAGVTAVEADARKILKEVAP